MKPDMRNYFYVFLGLHSFLIGIFPFYIPVYLYANGFSLDEICLFIAITGLGFCLCLYVWDRITQQVAFHFLVAGSYFSEIVLLSLFFLEKDVFFLLSAAFCNGIFNCTFWIIQRLLFLETINPLNSGKKFGNFQIFVLVVLKSAIFIGGLLLESSGFLSIYLVSAGVVLLSFVIFLKVIKKIEFKNEWRTAPFLSVTRVLSFRDRFRSRWIFAFDGIFLYLESYFWIISLFLIVRESFSRLGILVISLTVCFGVIFIFIKNKIDQISVNTFYKSAVVLYMFSWLLRVMVSKMHHLTTLLVLMAVITFCTSIFRLAFNKRFFDNAQSSTAHEYIYLKSYYSQGFLLLFLLFPLLFTLFKGSDVEQLSFIYAGAAVFSTIYLIYRK